MKPTTLEVALDLVVDQAVFAAAVGISEARVSQLVAEGVLVKGEPAKRWLLAYCERLREQAAGRGHELTIERAALARSQRIGQEIKNAVAERTYAPIGLLTDVLAEAATAVAARMDAFAGELRTVCPELNDAQRAHVMAALASARNAWVKGTASLSVQLLEELAEDATDGDEADAAGEDDEAEGAQP